MRPRPQWGQGWRKGDYHHYEKWNFTERKKGKPGPYRSANFSTTRTLSPRTVIGIGTTLS